MAGRPAPDTLPEQAPVDPPVEAPETPEPGAIGEDGFIVQPVAHRSVGKGPFLIGKSDIGLERRVTAADFASKGIVQDTLLFDSTNGFRLPLEGINPEAVTFLVDNEYGFSVSDE